MKRSLFSDSLLIGLIFLIGIALRLRQYLTLRSLWVDEAMLALNIVNRNFAELFQPLDLNQGAPIGFLLIEKFFNLLLGRHELVLRFFPFLAGLAALWLFYLLLKQVGGKTSVLVALSLFAVNPQLVYYSSESKQYIVDMAVTLALLVVALPVFQPQASKRDYALLALAGICALWLSHPALFVLAGIGLALLLQQLQKRDGPALRWIIGMGFLWLVNFILLYFINLRNLRGNPNLIEYWAGAFLPMPPTLNWLLSYFKENIQLQLGIQYFIWLALLIILAGWIMLYRESRSVALVFVYIATFAVIASALHLYPLKGRLALFMLPLEIILLGKGVEFVQKKLTTPNLANNIITLALAVYVLYSPFLTSLQYFITPKYFEHVRPYMDYLSASWKDGDVLFLSYWAEPVFRYYAPFYKLENITYTTNLYEDYSNPQQLETRFDALIGKKRVWVLFSHVYEQDGFNERDFVVAYLDEIGHEIRQFRVPNSSVYLFLYDLSR